MDKILELLDYIERQKLGSVQVKSIQEAFPDNVIENARRAGYIQFYRKGNTEMVGIQPEGYTLLKEDRDHKEDTRWNRRNLITAIASIIVGAILVILFSSYFHLKL